MSSKTVTDFRVTRPKKAASPSWKQRIYEKKLTQEALDAFMVQQKQAEYAASRNNEEAQIEKSPESNSEVVSV